MTAKKLKPKELRLKYDLKKIGFKNTSEVAPLEQMIGQQRAVKATEFGLRIKRPGYNIFMTGLTGTGKTSYAQEVIAKIAQDEPVPDDWLYVYNFKHPGEPIALNLPAGQGFDFCRQVEELLDDLKESIPKAFEGDDYERQKQVFVKEYQEARNLHLEELNQAAKEQGFALKRASAGFITIPVQDGEQLGEEEYAALAQEERDELEKKSSKVQLKAMEVMRRVQRAEKLLKEQLKELDQKVGLAAIGHLFSDLSEQYDHFAEIKKYLKAFEKDVLTNLADFRLEEEEQQNPMLWLRRQSQEQADIRYKVNLLVDHRETKGAPLVYETNPSYYNLLGRLEYENRLGMVVTDFSMIKPGALHMANGGYLILQAIDVLSAMQSWDVLKRVLKTEEIRIENIGEHFGLVAMATLRPEPIPLHVKVVMVGNPYVYQVLYHYDEDFKKLFKVKADFDTEMESCTENIDKMAGFIAYHCQLQNLRPFKRDAVAEIVEYSMRLAGSQKKLSTRFNEIVDLLFEAEAWAELDGKKQVGRAEVLKALKEMTCRNNRLEEKIMASVEEGLILLDFEGEEIGQVNALSVLNQGDYEFGRPSRITCTSSIGRKGIVNIERESDLSGSIHNKGVLILSGLIGHLYGDLVPVNLTASLCFEQSYGGIDGDSASAAELFCLLSSLGGVPLRQDLAVTGSINQKGEIQPVGGINSKIEGFYKACKLKGLTGSQGVIIPAANRQNLMLKQEVVDDVAKGLFHLYTIENVDEGLELLSGISAGTRNKDLSYRKNSFHARVVEELKRYNKILQNEKEKTRSKKTAGKSK